MSRKSKKGRGKKNKSIPLLGTIAAVYPAYKAYTIAGFTEYLPTTILYQYTGYDAKNGAFSSAQPIQLGMGIGVAYVAHKVFNKAGVNKHIKKLTGGWLTL